jgi:hypothetical protein
MGKRKKTELNTYQTTLLLHYRYNKHIHQWRIFDILIGGGADINCIMIL